MSTPAAPSVDFDRNRIGQGELIAGIAGFVLLISLWLDWYSISVAKIINVSGTAWDTMSLIPWILFIASLIAIAVAVLRGLNQMPQTPYPPAMIVAGAGAIAFVLVLFRVLSPPADGLGRDFGAFLALVAAAGVAYGGWRAMQDSGASFSSIGGAGAGPGGGVAPPPPSPPAPPAADPIPGTTAPQTPPGLAGQPPAGEGTRPPGV
jgi:hypothetical protein